MSKQKTLTKVSKLNKVRVLRKNLKKTETDEIETDEIIITYDLLVPQLQATF